jgi:hypothetical protein
MEFGESDLKAAALRENGRNRDGAGRDLSREPKMAL